MVGAMAVAEGRGLLADCGRPEDDSGHEPVALWEEEGEKREDVRLLKVVVPTLRGGI